jgi:hypothetical protein
MLRGEFRPWGQLNWVLQRLSPKKWSLLGCIGAEDRSLSCWSVINEADAIKNILMLEVHDEHADDAPHSKYFETMTELLESRRQEFLSKGGGESDIERFYLSDFYGRIMDSANQFIDSAGKNVIVDISSLPKRFFFPIIRLLMTSDSIQNLIATYTIPRKYSETQLAEDQQISGYLPTYLPPDDYDRSDLDQVLIVGLGYEPLGIRQVLEGKEFHLLFPYPSLPPGGQRNWEFVLHLNPLIKHQPERVHIYDVSETFERILSITNQGSRYAVLAPYGPKPMSLAMCLYAVSARSGVPPPAVFYTQPRAYNPEYCKGVKIERGLPKVLAYCLRLKGKCLF